MNFSDDLVNKPKGCQSWNSSQPSKSALVVCSQEQSQEHFCQRDSNIYGTLGKDTQKKMEKIIIILDYQTKLQDILSWLEK